MSNWATVQSKLSQRQCWPSDPACVDITHLEASAAMTLPDLAPEPICFYLHSGLCIFCVLIFLLLSSDELKTHHYLQLGGKLGRSANECTLASQES